jgi:hypothetical protein
VEPSPTIDPHASEEQTEGPQPSEQDQSHDDHDSPSDAQDLTVASGAATLAFLAAGVVGVTNPKKESVVVGGARVRPAVGLGSLALEGTF